MSDATIYLDVSTWSQGSILKKFRARRIGYVRTSMVDDEHSHHDPHQRPQHGDASNDILTSTPSCIPNGGSAILRAEELLWYATRVEACH